jgi:hypothetical protein
MKKSKIVLVAKMTHIRGRERGTETIVINPRRTK